MSPGNETPATRLLTERGVEFRRHRYDYEARGGAHHAAVCLGVPDHEVVKTLVMQDERGQRGLLLEIDPGVLRETLALEEISVAAAK